STYRSVNRRVCSRDRPFAPAPPRMPAVIGIIGYTHGVRLVRSPAPKRAGIATRGRSSMLPSTTRLLSARGDRRIGGSADRRIVGVDVAVQDSEELRDNRVASKGRVQPAVDEDRCHGLLEGSGKRNAQMRVLALAGTVHDASHHGHPELRDTGARVAPHRHLVSQVILDLLRHFLEEGAGGPAAAGTARHLRKETPETER